MSRIGKIICYGYRHPAKEWPCENLMGIHRLYHIHGGNGGCRHNGTDCPFLPGRLYFIPFSEDFEPYSDSDDPILHSYVDFELIPPLCTDRILSANPRNSGTAEAALAVFDAGARERGGKIAPTAPVEEDTPFGRLCTESILYLVSFIAEENNAAVLRDEIVLRALTRLHESMDQPLSVADIAGECYVNKDTFIRRFKKATGTTPYSYLKHLRLHTARLLRAEGLTYEEIAPRVGYADASSLLHALNKNK